MKKKLKELRYGDWFYQAPVSPIRKFVSLEFIDPEWSFGYWELTTEGEDGVVRKRVCLLDELDEEWDVLTTNK